LLFSKKKYHNFFSNFDLSQLFLSLYQFMIIKGQTGI